jgi:hypothetical protein
VSAESKMLEKHGWKVIEKIRRGCMVTVMWRDPQTGERCGQYWALEIQRDRNKAKKATTAA